MTLKAVVEKLEESKYRASIAEPFAIETEGATEEEAVNRLKFLAFAKLKDRKVVEIPVPESEAENHNLKTAGNWTDSSDTKEFLQEMKDQRRLAHPLMKMAGVWKHRTDLDEYRQAIEQHRKEMDSLEIL